MADYFSGTIEFPVLKIDAEIKAVLEEESVEFDDNHQPIRAGYDMSILVEDGIFTLSNSEARWGQFEDLEALLRDKGIPFDRESSQAYDYNGELVIFRPAANGNPAQDLTFQLLDGIPAVSVQQIRDLLPQGIEAVQADLDEHFPLYPPLGEYVEEG